MFSLPQGMRFNGIYNCAMILRNPFIFILFNLFWFGVFHLSGLFGPGIWVSDPCETTGHVQPVTPAWVLKVLILLIPVALLCIILLQLLLQIV